MTLIRTASTLAAVAATALVAACGGSDTQTAPAKSQSAGTGYDYGTPRTEAPSSSAVTITAADGRLADAKGRTLYLWEGDPSGKSACDGACAQAWPPLTTHGKPAAGEGAEAGLLGTIKRADGTLNVTYAGHPLYYFQGDAAAGQANGQGSEAFGASWWTVSPAGAAVEH